MRRCRPTPQAKVDFLRDARTYGGRAGTVRCIETHFAWVFLTARHAYKLKKPLRHRQMDYRSIAARERACREELRLNQRLAPSVYQSVVPLTIRDGALALDGDGEVVDWLVKMRRLPDERMLDRALSGAGVAPVQIDRVARRLLRFYVQARPWPMSGGRYLARLAMQVRQNRRAIRRYGARLPQSLSQAVCDAQLAALDCLRAELAARGACLVEGHGDLRAEHVYLGPPVAIIDSLEFDPRLRRLDPAEEVALLALEIERLGAAGLAERLVRRFCAGSAVAPSQAAIACYKSHRAATRAKLAGWHLDDPQFPDARPWIARAKSLLEDALRYARAVQLPHAADRRPAVQQRCKRSAADHARHRVRQKWRDVQQRQANRR